jgi:hypothetical protein
MDSQHQNWQGEERRTLSQIELQLRTLQDSIDDLRGAFPDGDVRGHCEAHKAMIEAANEQKAFWRGLKEEVGKRGIMFALITVAGLIWIGILVKLGLYHPMVPK